MGWRQASLCLFVNVWNRNWSGAEVGGSEPKPIKSWILCSCFYIPDIAELKLNIYV